MSFLIQALQLSFDRLCTVNPSAISVGGMTNASAKAPDSKYMNSSRYVSETPPSLLYHRIEGTHFILRPAFFLNESSVFFFKPAKLNAPINGNKKGNVHMLFRIFMYQINLLGFVLFCFGSC